MSFNRFQYKIEYLIQLSKRILLDMIKTIYTLISCFQFDFVLRNILSQFVFLPHITVKIYP